MGIVGCYSVHLYCDKEDRLGHIDSYTGYGPYEYQGKTLGECLRAARKDGWLIKRKEESTNHGNGLCLCPAHSGKIKPKDLEEVRERI